ncbi:MAG: hypothetical protein LBT78_08290 [Tannerella sp.]|jgi:hypothetical protein|nr:hypothetical protein [Tannerella sp.]
MRTKFVIYFLAILSGLNSCSKVYEVIVDSPARTVLAYMIASDLGVNLNNNIEDMIFSATAKNLNGGNLIVFYSKNQSTAELFEIKEGDGGVVTRHHIRDYEGKSAISPDVMREVVHDVLRLYPNDSYGLILSSHGTSWLPGDYSSLLRSFGEENRKRMEIYELAAGLPDHVFDFLIFDACSMASVECVYELRNKADYIVASPSETMRYGFPYKTVLPCLFTEVAKLEKAAENFWYFYKNEYIDPYGNISVTRTSELDELARVTKEIIAGAGENISYSPPLPDWQVLSYWSNAPTKLYDFDDVISRLATVEQYTRFAACMKKTISGLYTTEYTLCTANNQPIPVRRYSGLSVYPLQEQLPQLNEWYKQLEWYKTVYN